MNDSDTEQAEYLAELDALQAEAAGAEGEGAAGGEWIGPEPGAAQEAPDNGEELAALAKVVFDLMEAARGAHWHKSEKECAILGAAAAPVAEKYGGGSLPPEISLAVVLGSMVLPPLMVDRQLKRERSTEDKAPPAYSHEPEGAADAPPGHQS